MQLDDFNFDLPSELIAQYPSEKRSGSRLLCVNQNTIQHYRFYQITDLLQPGDLLILNDTKVIQARLVGRKKTGGKVEILIERILDQKRCIAQIRVSKSPQLGDHIYFANDISLEVTGRKDRFYELKYCSDDKNLFEIIESIGQLPLPPYIHRTPEALDLLRYQTIYAQFNGSVAAPTAGLHFDEELIQRLHDKNITMAHLTLHIGAGTFAPVRTEDIMQHKMHVEYCEVSEDLCQKVAQTKAAGKRVIAVGTTSMRALETASHSGTLQSYYGDTDIFIYPGYRFHCVDALITNFHLPRSTLIMLVTAFGGYDHIMNAYREAIQQNYRFFSYGDAMFVTGGGVKSHKSQA